ncbi:MAG: thiamine phosphate synthase [Pyrinomonadaceae bacterium]
MLFRPPKLYPITDVLLSGLSHAEQVVRLCEGGATLIQLREKNLAPDEFQRQAAEALREARKRGIRIIINDRVDLALALKADGVHLGQTDLPPEAARRLLGVQAIIGFSTHNVEQARHALSFPVDYLAIGPIFTTSSKIRANPVVGLTTLRKVRRAIGEIPLIAIGGITAENAAQVFAAGIDTVAVISAVVADPEAISRRTKQLLAL